MYLSASEEVPNYLLFMNPLQHLWAYVRGDLGRDRNTNRLSSVFPFPQVLLPSGGSRSSVRENNMKIHISRNILEYRS